MRALLLAGVAALGMRGAAHAAYIVTFYQAGSDVVAIGGGSINTAGLTLSQSNGNRSPFVNASAETELTGSKENTFLYNGALTISNFFGVGGSLTFATTGTGDLVGLSLVDKAIVVPANYISGALLSGTATYAAQTFTSLGLQPGSYVYGFGSGTTADSFTINIGGTIPVTTTVPEPATLALLGTGLLGMATLRKRRS